MPGIAQLYGIRRGNEIQVLDIISRVGIIIQKPVMIGLITKGMLRPELRDRTAELRWSP